EERVVEAATEEMILEAATEEPVVEVATEEVEVMAAVETEEPVIEAATEEVVVEVATEELVEVAMVATEEAEVNPLDLEGDIAAGEIVFNTTYPQTGFMCASCHTVTEDRERILGPSLYNISEIGLERIAETGDPDVATYVLNSMINPRDYIVPADDEGPYPEAIMPPNWGDVLTAQEQADVLAYVMSLGADEVEVEATEAATEEAADMMEVATEEAVEVVETEAALMQDTATEEAAPVETEEAAEAIETEEAAPVETEEAVEAVETEEAAPVETEEAETESAAAEVDVVAAAIAAGDVELGEQVFNMQYDTAVGPWICASCHSVTEDMLRLVGPGQWGLYERAEERLAESGDPDVVTYVRNSILMPQAYIVPADAGGPYPANLMPPNYGEVLTDEELDAVVAYLLTLGNPDYTE
ncbi:MAG: c-type cytochrome, partial [Chloroflexota bacterium]